jgi:tRNA pseudouridine38-40 synthase
MAGEEGKRRLALIVEYDGTAYHGSQYQKGVPTIQGTIETAIEKLTGEVTRVALAGRTDAGVHALGQVVAFTTAAPYSPGTIVRALNSYLPADISVRAVAEVGIRFQPRREASNRLYRYTIYNSRQRSPLWRDRAWHVSARLDMAAMNDAARCLIGTHDFAAFAPPLRGTTVRTVRRAEVTACGPLVTFEIEANAFLPHQVRRTVGALVNVGTGCLSCEGFRDLVELAVPNAASFTAPPQGLCLIRVDFEGVDFCYDSEEDAHV